MSNIYRLPVVLCLLSFLCPGVAKNAMAQNGWINEIHYQNASPDQDNFLEVVLEDVAAFPLSGWSVTLYNGADGSFISSNALTGFTPGTSSLPETFSVYTLGIGDLPNSQAGIALIYAGEVVQFISYGGAFYASGGTAEAMRSHNIPLTETTATPAGHSLQLSGTGNGYSQFSWTGPQAATKGTVNTGQTLRAKDQTTSLISVSPVAAESDAIASFSVLDFQIQDAGGDGLPSGFTRLAFTIGTNTLGVADADGLRLRDVLSSLRIRKADDLSMLIPTKVEFPDYQTVFLYFEERVVMAAESGNAGFSLMADVSATALIEDNKALSLNTKKEGFVTGPYSSRLAAAQGNLSGPAITFNIKATRFIFEGVPSLVKGDKPSDGQDEGELFSVTIKAGDENGRQDTDINDNLVLDLLNTADGRELFGTTYPEMTGGTVTVSDLLYSSSNLPELFRLTVFGGAFPGDPVPVFESQVIQAVYARNENSMVSAVKGSGTVNIPYSAFQDESGLTTANSVVLGSFTFTDRKSTGVSDNLATTIKAIKFSAGNSGNLQSLAIFIGSVNLAELNVSLQEEEGYALFENLEIVVSENSSLTLDVRATFQERVTDNAKIPLGIVLLEADPAGSQFADTAPVGIATGTDPSNDENRIEVTADRLSFISIPDDAQMGVNFSLELEATDEGGNRDLDETSEIKFTKSSGPGSLSPQPYALPLTAGHLLANGLQADATGLYSIKAEDAGAEISSAVSDAFQVFYPYTYEGLFITEIAHGNNEGSPRYLEITNTSSTETYGLENLILRVYQDGESTPNQVIRFTDGSTLSSGQSWVISNAAFSASWGGGFSGKSASQIHTGISGNGNDVYELYDNYHNLVLDVYGVKGENGSGKNWDYNLSLLNRKRGVTAGNAGTFSMAEFTVLPFSNALANPGVSTTADATGPAFTSALPVAGTQNVPETSTFSFTFNEPLNFESGLIRIKRKDNGTVLFSADVTNKEFVSGEGTNTIHLVTGIALPGSTEHIAEIATGAVTDMAGNNITGFVYAFKTTDSIHPTVVSLVPADNATGAALKPAFKITFSEPVKTGEGAFMIKDKQDDSFAGYVDVTSGAVTISGGTVAEFTLSNELSRLKEYYITAPAGIITDLAGNNFAGFEGNEIWTFTTLDPYANSPKVVKFDPENGEEQVVQNHKPVLTFQENVMKGSGTVKLHNGVTGEVVKTLDVATAEGITTAGTKATFDFGTLSLNTSYYITLSEGSFTDTDPEKHPLEQISGSSQWSFKTVETAAPLLVIQSEENPLFFGAVPANTESVLKVYRLGGRNLSANMTLEIPEPFSVSADGGNTFKKGSLTFTPAELAGYRNLVVKFAPKTANGALVQADLVHRSEGAKNLLLGVLGREGAQPATISIAEARAMAMGAEVEISGVVTDGKGFGDNRRFVQDVSGAIAIHTTGPAASILENLKSGNLVKVKGVLSETYGQLLQLSGENLKVDILREGDPLPEPKRIYAAQVAEKLESHLVVLQNLQFDGAGGTFRAGQIYSFTDTKGGKGYIKTEGAGSSLVNTTIPAVATVTGIITQENQYYVLPRGLSDVVPNDPKISLDYPDGKLNFGFVKAGATSKPLRLRINGTDLIEDIIITAEAPFGLSLNSVHFSQRIVIPAGTTSASIWVQFAPVAADGAIYHQQLMVNSMSAAEAGAAVAGVEGEKSGMVSITQARVMRPGETVSLKGIVTTGSTISVSEKYMQDAGAGIVALLAGDQAFAELPAGAEIKVQGTLQETDGLLQVSNISAWEILNKSAGEPAALLTGAGGFGELNEGRLLKLEGIRFVKEGNFQAGKWYEIIFPGGESALVKIPAGAHPLAGVRIPFLANITGVLSESAEGHMLLPRKAEDLKATDAVVHTAFPQGDIKFLFVEAGKTSAAATFTVSGERLQGNINLRVGAPFEISVNGTSFSTSATIPQANAAGATVYVRYRPTLGGGGVSEDFVVLTTTNGRTVKVPVTGIEGKQRPEVQTISLARALGAGERVKIQGILTTGSQFFAGRRFVQDGTGGIVVVAAANILAGFEAGDKVEISGILENNGNLLQLSKEVSITSLQKGAGIPAPRLVNSAADLGENNEAELMAVNGIRFITSGYFVQGQSYSLLLENGESALVRIGGDNNTLAGTIIPGLANLKGLLVQRGNEYELLPRGSGDLEMISSQKAIILLAAENGYDFGMVKAGTSSAAEQYSITGLSLNEIITVSVAAPFELSANNKSWSQSIELSGSAGKVPVYVRFSPSAENGKWYVAEITHHSDGEKESLWVQATEGTVPPALAGPDFSESFDQCFDLNSFTRYDASGSETWSCAPGYGKGNSGAVGINYASAEPQANEDWLISPAMNIAEGTYLSFDLARQFAGPDLEVLVSVNYSGSGKPSLAKWKALAADIPAAGKSLSDFKTVKDISLKEYAGKTIHVAYKYTATYSGASAYILDNVNIQAMPMAGFRNAAADVQEGTTISLVISLSQAAKQAGVISLRLTAGSGFTYGAKADFTTSPAMAAAGTLEIQVQQGQQEVSFELHAYDDLLQEADELLTMEIVAAESGLLIDRNASKMTATIKSNNAESMNIATARMVNEQGEMLNKDKLVKLKGVAYGPNLSTISGGLEFRLSDHAAEKPSAITVSLATASALGYSLKDGDELEVTGVLRNQNGLSVIEPQLITVLKQGVALKEPVVVTAINESTESLLLTLEQVEIMSGWQKKPAAAFNVLVKDAQGREFNVQIRPGTDLYGMDKPAGIISITGFGAQEDSGQPFTDGYYLLPGSSSDIKQITAIGKEAIIAELKIYPNPAGNHFFISSPESHQFEQVQLTGMNGTLLSGQPFTGGTAINTENLPTGIYMVKIILKDGTYAIRRLSVIK